MKKINIITEVSFFPAKAKNLSAKSESSFIDLHELAEVVMKYYLTHKNEFRDQDLAYAFEVVLRKLLHDTDKEVIGNTQKKWMSNAFNFVKPAKEEAYEVARLGFKLFGNN